MKLRFESIFASSKSDSNFSRNKGIAKGANRLCAAKQARRATTSSSFETTLCPAGRRGGVKSIGKYLAIVSKKSSVNGSRVKFCGRHLKELGRSGGEELTLTTTSVNLLSALTCGAGHFSSNYILNKAMPIVLDAIQKASIEDGNQRPLRLNFVTKLIDGSSILPTAHPEWYDTYLHECFVSAFAINPNVAENNEVGCLALMAGMHFIETKDAENIFDHLLKQTIKDGRKINEPEMNLYSSLIQKLEFSRPKNEEIIDAF